MSLRKICFYFLLAVLMVSGVMILKNTEKRHISNKGIFVFNYVKAGVSDE